MVVKFFEDILPLPTDVINIIEEFQESPKYPSKEKLLKESSKWVVIKMNINIPSEYYPYENKNIKKWLWGKFKFSSNERSRTYKFKQNFCEITYTFSEKKSLIHRIGSNGDFTNFIDFSDFNENEIEVEELYVCGSKENSMKVYQYFRND